MALLDHAVAAGPMLVHGRHEFWTIDLVDEPFELLVIEVEAPGAVVEAVTAAVESARRATDEDAPARRLSGARAASGRSRR
jgi:hypothetical protein